MQNNSQRKNKAQTQHKKTTLLRSAPCFLTHDLNIVLLCVVAVVVVVVVVVVGGGGGGGVDCLLFVVCLLFAVC